MSDMFSRASLKRAAVVTLGLAASGSLAAGPCDIYASGGNPCVAAHSTTRALYGNYTGSLYQVKRADGKTADIATVSAGGIANASAQDSFCSGTTCVISEIYDQSGRGNHLGQATGYWKGPGANGVDNFASATGAPVTLNGQKVYGVFIPPGTGYRRSQTSGIPTGDAPEGMYDVIDGTHFNQWCCFDYGNSETGGTDTGNGHMEAIYFGDSTQWDSGSGKGPWIMADLENGMYSGANPKNNPEAPITYRFITAVLKGMTNHFGIRGANAASGSLSYYYNGTRPSGYSPMHKEGAIILGTGGDNSNSGQGTWYEGAMVTGYPSDATEDAVQANIVAAKYGTTSMTSGRAIAVGSSISLAAATGTTPSARRRGIRHGSGDDGDSVRYITHTGSVIHTEVVSSSSGASLKQQASWTVRAGLGNSACFSFESSDTPGSYIRNDKSDLVLSPSDGSKQFNEDATFCPQAGLNGQGHTHSLQSWNQPTHNIRHHENAAYAARNGGHRACDTTDSFSDDASWVIIPGFTEL